MLTFRHFNDLAMYVHAHMHTRIYRYICISISSVPDSHSQMLRAVHREFSITDIYTVFGDGLDEGASPRRMASYQLPCPTRAELVDIFLEISGL